MLALEDEEYRKRLWVGGMLEFDATQARQLAAARSGSDLSKERKGAVPSGNSSRSEPAQPPSDRQPAPPTEDRQPGDTHPAPDPSPDTPDGGDDPAPPGETDPDDCGVEPCPEVQGGAITRVWVWLQRAPNFRALDSYVQNRVDLGITDFVVTLNDYSFPGNRLAIKSKWRNGPASNRWEPLITLCDAFRAAGVDTHLMVFFRPDERMINEAADALEEMSPLTRPRSIQFDLEGGWWTRRPLRLRQAARRVVANRFLINWMGHDPELGFGITHIASAPPPIASMLDFLIPQMYASQGNYTNDLPRAGLSRARHHYGRAVERRGSGAEIFVGQTANPTFVDAARMKGMLDVVLQLGSGTFETVREVAFWSDRFLERQSDRRRFIQHICGLARDGGINRQNLAEAPF